MQHFWHYRQLSTAVIFISVVNHVTGLYGNTAAQLKQGYSGNYGLGGEMGGLTLAMLGYGLETPFTLACKEMGIDLGIYIPSGDYGLSAPTKWESPDGYGSAVDLDVGTSGEYLSTSNDYGSGNLHGTGLFGSIGNIGSIGYTSSVEHEPSGAQFMSSPEYIHKAPTHSSYSSYFKKGVDLLSPFSPQLSAHSITGPDYKIDKYSKQSVSGYSAHIIHTPKPGSHLPSGESQVYFNQLHTEPSKILTAPELSKSTLYEPSDIHSYSAFQPFGFEDPIGYQSTINHKYGSVLTGGYGSMLTGSYGSMLTNGYRRTGLLSEGGLKGLEFSYLKKK